MSIAIESTITAGIATGDVSTSHTVDADATTLVLLLGVDRIYDDLDAQPTVPESVTYDGDAFTLVDNIQRSMGGNRELNSLVYTLKNPSVGSNTFAITFTGTNKAYNYHGYTILCLSGANNASLIGSIQKLIEDNDSSQEPNTNHVTSYDNSLIVASLVQAHGSTSYPLCVEIANTTEPQAPQQEGAYFGRVELCQGYRQATTAGSYAIGWTATNKQKTYLLTVAIREEKTVTNKMRYYRNRRT